MGKILPELWSRVRAKWVDTEKITNLVGPCHLADAQQMLVLFYSPSSLPNPQCNLFSNLTFDRTHSPSCIFWIVLCGLPPVPGEILVFKSCPQMSQLPGRLPYPPPSYLVKLVPLMTAISWRLWGQQSARVKEYFILIAAASSLGSQRSQDIISLLSPFSPGAHTCPSSASPNRFPMMTFHFASRWKIQPNHMGPFGVTKMTYSCEDDIGCTPEPVSYNERGGIISYVIWVCCLSQQCHTFSKRVGRVLRRLVCTHNATSTTLSTDLWSCCSPSSQHIARGSHSLSAFPPENELLLKAPVCKTSWDRADVK